MMSMVDDPFGKGVAAGGVSEGVGFVPGFAVGVPVVAGAVLSEHPARNSPSMRMRRMLIAAFFCMSKENFAGLFKGFFFWVGMIIKYAS